MKVKDLIAKLNHFKPESDVLCTCEDLPNMGEGVGFKVFEIEGVDAVDAERVRMEDGTPNLKLGKSDISSKLVVLDLASDC